MKTALFVLFILFAGISLNAQVNLNVKKKVNREANNRANKKTDQAIDKTFDKLEEGIGNLFKKKNKKNKKGNQQGNESTQQTNSNSNNSGSDEEEQFKPAQLNVQWSKFDFVPGDEVIFEDSPSADEENGEFPSRWDLVKGQVEIATVDGENVLMFIDGNPEIVPYLKNAKEDYLPEVFTIEFDFYKPVNGNRISVYLYDNKNQEKANSSMYMDISTGAVSEDLSGVSGDFPGIDYTNSGDARWIHVSIAFSKGKLKVYMDDTRVINIPHYEGNPSGLTLQAYFAELKDDKAFYFKNIRIAKGGVKYYNRVLSDGKIIVNGIRFDVNKATIKPESNGAINEIFQLMQKQPDLNFSVEGHTDSDGDEALNQTLSEKRAEAVMNRLIDMGISANRLKYAGWGESKPIGENGTAEGKANNRRVEFVKFAGTTSLAPSNQSNPVFDKLNNDGIINKLDNLPNEPIQISNNQGIVNGSGTVIVYATSDGNLGKMEILDVDKNDNYKLTIKYITYKADGSIHSQSEHLEIQGTYTCDLDNGNAKDMIASEVDFRLGRQDKNTTTIYAGEISTLRVISN